MTLPRPSLDQAPIPPFAVRRRMHKRWRWLLGGLCLALAWQALARVAWAGVWDLLSRLGPLAILALVSINLLILPLMTGRWWLLLRTLGAPVGLLAACAYKVAVNAINYLTPGPHFGGEPFSVFLLHRRHNISLASAATSVALDRLLELSASMMVLTFCLIHLAFTRSAPFSGSKGPALAAGLLSALSLMLAGLFTGRRPLSRVAFLIKRLDARPARWIAKFLEPLAQTIAQGEAMAESIFRGHRIQFLFANLFSLGHWLGVFAEFWSMSALLGLPLSLGQLTAVVVVARLSFFTPLPAGIGVLETALPWVTAAIGPGSSLGVSLCVIIRMRDLLFSLVGLGLAVRYWAGRQKAVSANQNQVGPIARNRSGG